MAEQLARSYRMQWLLAAAYIAAVAMSASRGETRAAATLMAVLATSLPAWPVVTATRTAVRLRTHIPHGVDSRVLVGCLSFNPRQAIAVRLRALGGMRVRWAAPLIAGGLALVGTLMLLGFLLQRLGVDTGAGVGPVSAVVAAWAFYRTLRHTKLTAAAVRAHDARPPVLILRRFTDDVLGKARLDASTFEHALAADLNRIGPTVAIGRPGERLQPLGAARDYPSSDWQGTVRALMQEAELVVFLLATSENLNWEFKTAMAARGLARVLVLAPPMARADVEQRWIAFVDATADVLPTTLRQTLPDQRLLAVLFAGEEAVSIVVSGTALRQSMVARSWPEYRLVIRIRESLRPEDLASINALEAFLRQHLPFVTLSASPVP